eukprot:CAMPEP_0113942476 /NCGR_PEP_ID=MMETSP1339-20121228/8190_1 /TAXON_ID=94617 /ORGANISM="Fibrocapsa japonica" /LENGTH=73 /DNA_ID=CAMNT_0000946969 /DNA_START=147 /DNA_END=368 /DNA_ORIENTATION=- /assembly_acc=CAM_ASM_000762
MFAIASESALASPVSAASEITTDFGRKDASSLLTLDPGLTSIRSFVLWAAAIEISAAPGLTSPLDSNTSNTGE